MRTSYVFSIFITLSSVYSLDPSQSTWEDLPILYANTVIFCISDLSMYKFWYLYERI